MDTDEPLAGLDLVHERGTPSDALLYRSLYWPDLVEIDGVILLAEAVVPQLRDRFRSLLRAGHPRIALQKEFNALSLPMQFGFRGSQIDLQELGQLLIEIWLARLKSAYPGRHFIVEVVASDEEDIPTLTFCEAPP